MGCAGCELYPSPFEILRKIDAALATCGITVNSKTLLKKLIRTHYSRIQNPGPGHRDVLTTTNLWHLRGHLCDEIAKRHGPEASTVSMEVIRMSVTCYAAKLHLNRGASLVSPERGLNKGYAVTFEQLTPFPGRMEAAAGWADLLGTKSPDSPWKNDLARLVFISDMGDSFSTRAQFAFLEREAMGAITSENGRRHLWQWLTKRPKLMREFSDQIGGFPENVCAMTTMTGPESLDRVDDLRQVQATCKGLSIEPLWQRIPPADLNLRGIDWLIIGGESGSGELTRPFHIEWAEELLDHCRKQGVACFIKQLGRNPIVADKPLRLADPHGGDWDEWPQHLRIREFPEAFQQYRASEKKSSEALSRS
jgi:protein gp37